MRFPLKSSVNAYATIKRRGIVLICASISGFDQPPILKLGAGEMAVGASYRYTPQLIVPYNFLARCSDESLVLCIELTCTVLRYGSGIATQIGEVSRSREFARSTDYRSTWDPSDLLRVCRRAVDLCCMRGAVDIRSMCRAMNMALSIC
jgi:hypothetical protein